MVVTWSVLSGCVSQYSASPALPVWVRVRFRVGFGLGLTDRVVVSLSCKIYLRQDGLGASVEGFGLVLGFGFGLAFQLVSGWFWGSGSV